MPEFADVPSLNDDFKFDIYTGFASAEEAIALPLLEALSELDTEKKNFEHIGQLSRGGDRKPIKWTEDYFKKFFSNLEGEKIWVCGPPIVQENFDRAAMSIKNPKVQFAAM